MKAFDFEYDGKNLSDFGMVICYFGNKDLDTVSNGSKITFNTVSTLGGSKHQLISTQYEDCLETTIQICKNSCNSDVLEISSTEFRELTRWLNRKKFLKFKILDEDYIDLYFEASFNISRIEINGRLYGLELEVITNRPFALKEPKIMNFDYSIKSGNMDKKYIWNKYTIDKGLLVKTVANEVISVADFDEDDGVGSFRDVMYSENITWKSYPSYECSLSEPITTVRNLIDDSIVEKLKGKYIYSTYSGKYYEIPAASDFSYYEDGEDMFLIVNKAIEYYIGDVTYTSETVSSKTSEVNWETISVGFENEDGLAERFNRIEYSDNILMTESSSSIGHSLVEPITTITNLNNSKVEESIKGKFIYSTYSGKYYKIPEDANFIWNSDGKKVSFIVSNATEFCEEEKEDSYYPDIFSYSFEFNKIEFVQNKKCVINDLSHEEGYIYPRMEILIKENGDLNICNSIEDRNTFISNCVAGEIITMDYPVIKSSLDTHNIQNDFNWNFFRIANTFNNIKNDITLSIPCIIKMEYSPIIKVGL